MKKERQFHADQASEKRVYQSPAVQVVKLGMTPILQVSTQVSDPWENPQTEEEW